MHEWLRNSALSAAKASAAGRSSVEVVSGQKCSSRVLLWQAYSTEPSEFFNVVVVLIVVILVETPFQSVLVPLNLYVQVYFFVLQRLLQVNF